LIVGDGRRRNDCDLMSELVQEWPERIYPIYANGPGYILSEDVVHFIVEESERGTLRVRFSDIRFGLSHVLVILFNIVTFTHGLVVRIDTF